MKKILIGTLVFMSGCTTYDPYTGEEKSSNTTHGAVLGGLAGAAIGAAAGGDDKRKSIAKGALAGAVVGGGIGYYMDRQEAKLREELKGSGVQVSREGDKLRLVMNGNITFSTAKSNIRMDFSPVLKSVVKVLEEFKETSINISGYTDSTGSSDFNQRLSEQRAESVKAFLIEKGIVAGRVHAVGYGKRYPIATNTTEEGRQQNRRVELTLEKTE